MFILKKGHQPGVYVPLRALFLVKKSNCQTFIYANIFMIMKSHTCKSFTNIHIDDRTKGNGEIITT